VDIDKAQSIADYMQIRSLPTIYFYHSGSLDESLSVIGYNPVALENNIKLLIERSQPNNFEVLTEDNIVEDLSSDEESVDKDAGDGLVPEYDTDPERNEYGQDCDIMIEKTI